LPNAPRVQRLTTPMRSPTTPLPTRGGGTAETYTGPSSDDGRNPDSNDGSEL